MLTTITDALNYNQRHYRSCLVKEQLNYLQSVKPTEAGPWASDF